jgi:FkbM family methyltransferase
MYLCKGTETIPEMNFKSKVKAFYKGVIFYLSASNSSLFTLYYNLLYKPEKGTLDDFTSRFSNSQKRVMVVQIGANDGINNDPIHKFIKRDHWQGALLEPQKYVFQKYLEPLHRKTKGITVVNAALDKEDGFRPIYKISVSNSRWATGLASFNRKILEEAITSGYIEIHAKKEGCLLPENKDDCIAEEIVKCISTDTLLKIAEIDRTDWLQIDTEGFDFEIIKMFNIDVTRPKVIVFENLHLSHAVKKECFNHLKINGYIFRDYGANTLAMRNPPKEFKQFFDRMNLVD